MINSNTLNIINDWILLDEKLSNYFTNEGKWEIGNPEHLLYGIDFKILVKRNKREEYIAVFNDTYYFIHLTWKREKEKSFPASFTFDNLDMVNYLIKYGIEEYEKLPNKALHRSR